MSDADYDWNALRSGFDVVQPGYVRLVSAVVRVIEDHLRKTNFSVVSVSGRPKDFESFKEKVIRRRYRDPMTETKDLAGVRVVCNYAGDLGVVGGYLAELFEVKEVERKAASLGADKMGYDGVHHIVRLGSKYSGGIYEGIGQLSCEIQVRTILQDAWATINHNLVYKNEGAVPVRLRRDLNKVAALLEVAQDVFDNVRDKRQAYLVEIADKESKQSDFLRQSVDYDTLIAYSKWKFPKLPASERVTNIALRDLNLSKYPTLKDIDLVVDRAREAVARYQLDQPQWFNFGTDFITKSLGFVDNEFRQRHGFALRTKQAFEKYQTLVK